MPIVLADGIRGALRVTYPTSFVDDADPAHLARCSPAVGACVLGIVFLVSLRLARSVTKPLDDLERAAARLGAG